YMRIPYYVVFDRYENQLHLFQLIAIQYQPVELSEAKFWIPKLELGLGVWQGKYQETEGLWLRWYDGAGNWIETSAERAKRLAEKLRTLGINPDDL
ncbi:MAG: hypothetical protein F6J98_40000, partial [Moorea sp. SIO4G2]|nr:hypothetical protein [Moorena sp. SIO4G2]